MHESRNKQLSNAAGSASLDYTRKELVPYDRKYEFKKDSKGNTITDHGKWSVAWYQKGDNKRSDIHVEPGQEGNYVGKLLVEPGDKRVVTIGEKK